MSNIGAFIQAYQDKHGSSDRALALRVGVTPTLIGKWKHGRFVELPKPELIEALAQQMGVKYDLVLDAFLADAGYREDVMGNAEHPAPTSIRRRPGNVSDEDEAAAVAAAAQAARRGRSSGRAARAAQDADAEAGDSTA